MDKTAEAVHDMTVMISAINRHDAYELFMKLSHFVLILALLP